MMQYNDHIRILDLASRSALPEQLDEQSDLPIDVVRELVEGRYLTAIDVSSFTDIAYMQPRITLSGREFLDKLRREEVASVLPMVDALLRMQDIMVAVSTGGPRIQQVNEEYTRLYRSVDLEFRKRGVPNPISFEDLWAWYGRWSSGDLPSYLSRRMFLADLFAPALDQARAFASGRQVTAAAPTGWGQVDRRVGEVRRRLAEAETEEQFQTVGLLCREALISLAEAVYDSEKHPPLEEKQLSETDFKRRIDAYFAVELAGPSSEVARKHARAALDLANDLQHRRTAEFRLAALCVEATASVINVVAIVSGKRDPGTSQDAAAR